MTASGKQGQNDKRLRKALRPKIRKRLETMWSHEEAARRFADPEGVHQMRVASRKLRAALSASGDLFARKGHRRVGRKVRQLTRALGDVRDPDVLLAQLHAIQEAAEVRERPGVTRLIDRLEHERDDARARLLSLLDELEREGFREASIAAFRDSGKQGTPPRIRRRDARRIIISHIQAFLQQAGSLPDEENVDGLHDLRIATKRLRYALQLVRKPLEPEASPLIENLTDLQDQMGEIHNQDVLIDLIRDELHVLADTQMDRATAGDRDPDAESPARSDLLALLAETAAERHRRYTALQDHWDGSGPQQLIDQLRALTQ